MMTQNIPYKGYLSSKWWLMVINYCNYWLHPFIFILDGVFNHCRWRYLQYGVNSQLVLLGGAYTKTPIDLSSGRSI
jgi:hypothetical protein